MVGGVECVLSLWRGQHPSWEGVLYMLCAASFVYVRRPWVAYLGGAGEVVVFVVAVFV
jgi:hypothetical protein